MILSHSYDHRIINGAMGGLFIKTLKQRIENWDSSQQL
jgi:2-oxoglutarate dehydrogenase E2 component (dihydrolipoamide succinyltransferase)